MEGGTQGIGEPPSEDPPQAEDEWVADWLDELCGYYLFLGVPCRAFWHGDYTQLRHYVRAHDLRRQQKSEEMWLQGFYIHDAFSTVLANAFAKKGAARAEYLEEPIRLIPYTESEQKAIAQREREKAIAYFEGVAKRWDAKQKAPP